MRLSRGQLRYVTNMDKFYLHTSTAKARHHEAAYGRELEGVEPYLRVAQLM